MLEMDMFSKVIETLPISQQFMLCRLSELQGKPVGEVLGDMITIAYDKAIAEANNKPEPEEWVST